MRFILTLLIFFFIQEGHCREVSMAFGERLPPFILPETNSGIEIEIVKNALAYKGHTLKPEYYPMARLTTIFNKKQVESIMMDVGEDMTKVGAFYGDVPVVYENVFITLKKRNIKINRPEDLKGLSIIGFVGAAKRYPNWLSKKASQGTYKELNDQSVQVKLLHLGRADVVLSDKNIFRYYLNMYKKELRKDEDILIDEHHFTSEDPKNYRPVFRDEKIKNDFNEGLRHLFKSNRQSFIYDKYLKK